MIDKIECLLAVGRTRRSTVRENDKNHKRSERIQARSATVATRHNAGPSASHYLQKTIFRSYNGYAAMSAFRQQQHSLFQHSR